MNVTQKLSQIIQFTDYTIYGFEMQYIDFILLKAILNSFIKSTTMEKVFNRIRKRKKNPQFQTSRCNVQTTSISPVLQTTLYPNKLKELMTFIGGPLILTPFTISVVLLEKRFDNAFTSSAFKPNTAESDACNEPLTATYVNVPSGVIGTATVTTFGGDSIL